MPELVSVPNLDGVPPVLFAPGFAAGLALVQGDAPGALAAFSGAAGRQWGLFRNGRMVIQADGVAAFDHKREWLISDYPVERGAFESYDKVVIPYDVRFVFMAGGSDENKNTLLRSVTSIAGDLNVYDGVMPEKVFPNLNVIHYDLSRTAQRGVGLLMIALWCQEVRQTTTSAGVSNPSATGSIGQTAAPSGADPVDGGTVQARDATPAEMSGVGSQAFAGGYNVGAGTTDGTTLGGASFGPGGYNADGSGALGMGANFGNTPIAGPESIATPDGTGFSGGIDTPGQITLPGGMDVPQTTSDISGLQAAGPDQYNIFGVSP